MPAPPADVTLQRVEQPSEARIGEAAALFYALMKDDAALRSLTGGEPDTLLAPLGAAMLRAGAHSGHYYEATHPAAGLVGFLMTMPPGQDMFATPEQRALGLDAFMARLSDAGKEYYRTTYMVEFPAFVNSVLGPTGRRDSWYLHMLMVKPDFQGRGIGKGLIDVVRAQATQHGDVIAMSCTTPLNAEIYQKCGLHLRAHKDMPSPWGDWPLYLLSLDTKEG